MTSSQNDDWDRPSTEEEKRAFLEKYEVKDSEPKPRIGKVRTFSFIRPGEGKKNWNKK